MNYVAEDILMHYGMPRRSGRYPWGSGENPHQHGGDFLSRVDELRGKNFTYTDSTGKVWTGDTAIAKSMNLSTTQFRTQLSLAKDERRQLDVATAKGLREKGYSLNEIADKMGFNNDSSVRSLLNEDSEARMNQARATAEFLKKQIEEKGMIDVGVGVERNAYLGGISRGKLEEALYILELEGYPTYCGRVPQVTNAGKQTTLKVVCPPGTEHKDIYDFKNIHSLDDDFVTHDGGETFDPKWVYPKSMDSKRLQICYAEEGGELKDGVVELRRGVPDLSLGESTYAQVRILVDDSRYIKGMAVYADDLPDGIDVRFNTNKSKSVAKMDVLKKIKNDPDNPFGSLIKEGVYDPDDPDSIRGGQSYYYDKNGKKQLSLINKRAEEGDWGEWADKLPSQFLSKQNMTLIRKQLDLASADKQAEFDEICSLTNPTVKKAMLRSFADDCDSAAVHLQAAALPRQKYQVILPLTSIKDNEVYAPNYKDGETVALIRYPHGGTFEIPILTVNNKQSEGRRVLGNTPADAIGINKKVADRLSGADFDGDTVMVIPTGGKTKITSTKSLAGLEGFDPKMAYPARKGMKEMKNTQTEMGKISNLITDMTLRGATEDELARAVRHSMVVIDAEKHHLDYKQSEQDNGIASLKKKYQGAIDPETGRYHEGAATLISRAKSEVSVNKRKGSPKINEKGKDWYDPDKPEGALVYKNAHRNEKGKPWYDPTKPEGTVVYAENRETYVDKKTGRTVVRAQASTKMAETQDARTLISDGNTPQERAYADYANKMKSLANQARKEMVSTGKIPYSASAKAAYSNEVNSLMAKLNVALKNAPKERQAQIMANSIVDAKKQENPDMTRAEIKKASQQALTQSRAKVGAQRTPIKISDQEWEAIQAGAISENQLTQILNNTNIDDLRQRATPRATTTLSPAKVNHMKTLRDSGYTTAQIADKLGVSSSTVSKYLNGKE